MADPKTENKEIVNDKARVGDDKARAAAFAEPLKEIGKNEVDFEKDREGVDRELEARSEKNEEGHAKNMEKIERAHEKNEGQPDPKLGRADNGATPVIDPVTGKKSWPAPRVAGIK